MSSRENIFLIGNMKHQIMGSKLPSRGDCLKVLIYNMRITKLNLNESAALVIDECLVFLETHPDTWSISTDYKKGEEIIQKLKVVNFPAERGIKLIEEFDKKITKNEEQKQFLLQTIQDYRQKYPKPT